MSLDIEQYEWLVSPAGREVLQIAALDSRQWARMQGVTPAQRILVDAQVRLRAKAAAKFPEGGELFFTSIGLQQSTDSMIARYKSTRFVGLDTIADFCCGIGGDLNRLGAVGCAIGYDRDPLHVLLANANCAALGVKAEAKQQDVTTIDPNAFDAWHIDPDRRASGGRTIQPDHFQPSTVTLQSMLCRNPIGAVKMAPATPTDVPWLQEAELEWIGHSRSCQQVVAWFGELARNPTQRVATLLRPNEPPVSFVGEEEPPNVVDQIDEYIFEPHSAVLAASLAGTLANSVGLDAVIPGGGYLTGRQPHASPLLSAFRVLEATSFRPKKIRKRLANLGCGIVEVKQRGVNVDPTMLQKRWRGEGNRGLTVLVTRRGKSIIAIIVERVVDNS
ncbi:hypothetical protein ACFL2H_01850 [Planctomycetota bacterium]